MIIGFYYENNSKVQFPYYILSFVVYRSYKDVILDLMRKMEYLKVSENTQRII